jgi:hypothetical protein
MDPIGQRFFEDEIISAELVKHVSDNILTIFPKYFKSLDLFHVALINLYLKSSIVDFTNSQILEKSNKFLEDVKQIVRDNETHFGFKDTENHEKEFNKNEVNFLSKYKKYKQKYLKLKMMTRK